MVKKQVTYTDYNGVQRTEEFLFNLNKIELLTLDLDYKGGLEGKVKEISETENVKELLELFKKLLTSSYGVKSEDGKRFIKSEEIFKNFTESPAYDAIMMELITGGIDVVSNFMNALIPEDIDSKDNLKVVE